MDPLTETDVAQICHEANRALQIVQADPTNPPSDPWDVTSAEIQASAASGVHIRLTTGATPEQMHQSWCDLKLATGWTYGSVKNEALREHPCLLPYDQLPPGQQLKDALFSAIVDVCSLNSPGGVVVPD